MTSLKLITELKNCSDMRDLDRGKRLHHQAMNVHDDKYVSSALVKMYSRCNSMQLAQQVFNEMSHRDVVAWNTLITGYVENGQGFKALEIFSAIDCVPNAGTYIAALKACGCLARKKPAQKHVSLEKGAAIHKDVKARGLLDGNVAIATTLIDMYGKCGSMNEAKRVFDEMPQHNVVTWNSLLSGYMENGKNTLAVDLFFSMDCEPSPVTYMVALKACGGLAHVEKLARQSCLEKGASIHERLKHSGLEDKMEVATSLLDMYSKCGSMRRAREVFDGMKEKDVVAWTSLILGYVDNGECFLALDMFAGMDCRPNSFTYMAVLKAYGFLGAENSSECQLWLDKGVDLHETLRKLGLARDVLVATVLVEMYCKLGSLIRAKEVFDGMRERNVATWTSLMLGYVEVGENCKAVELFSCMDCEASFVTYVALLKAYGGLANEKVGEKDIYLEKTISVHEQIKRKGCEREMILATTLLDTYRRCGGMELAKKVFDSMAWKDVVAWTSLILGYVDNGQSGKAVDAFMVMECKPDSLSYVAVLKACGSLGAISVGKQIHSSICKVGVERDQVVTGALMDFYAKSGSIVRAVELFDNIQTPCLVLWNTLIAGYSSVGDSFHVFRMAEEIQLSGLQMDSITFVCMLTACSRRGLVRKGKLYFQSMLRYGIIPSVEHYNCMVDMLSRANRIQEALALICDMPFVANNVTWITLLGACNKWKNVEVGKVAFDEQRVSTKSEWHP